MTYQALYRVWRPRTFEDLVGQSHITQTLQNAISEDKFSHAYLFSGPRGTGKTSAAKIFAQTINCEKMPAKEPCNECVACRGILDGSISDVIEIDAASNTSVDDIRDIRDKVKYAPSTVPYKVYIIDEVHMISVNAFNALLKTLEEPPAHVVFILATTEPHKIPLTIISRCQRFDFKSINNKVIADRMQEIMTEEQVDISSEALEAIALAAEGGMRDALSILDQTISYSDGKIEMDDVLAVTGSVSQEILTEITEAMFDQNTEITLQLFDEMIMNGKDPGRFVFDMIYFLRDVLFYKTTANLAEYLERAIVTDSFQQLTEKVDEAWVQQVIVSLTECEQQIKWTNSPRIFVEITILTITNRHDQVVARQPTEMNQAADALPNETVQQLLNRVQQLESLVENLQAQPTENRPAAPRRREPSRAQGNSYAIPHERVRGVLDVAEKPSLEKVQAQWDGFLLQLKGMNAPAHATIQNSKPVAASDQGVVVAFKYEIHCSLFLDHKETVESTLANTLTNHLTIIPIPEDAWMGIRQDYLNNQERQNPEEPKEEEAIVTEAQKMFGEDIVEIEN